MSQHQCDQPQENTPESSEGNDQQTPFLEEKTLYLLKALGQTQSWLSQQVGWKDRSSVSQAFEKGRIPTTKYSEWCNALQVPAKILELPNIDAFKEAVEATQDSRVGNRWMNFALEQGHTGVRISRAIEQSLDNPGRQVQEAIVRGLYKSSEEARSKSQRSYSFYEGDRVKFYVSVSDSWLPEDGSLATYILLLYYSEGRTLIILDPDEQPLCPKKTGQDYVFPLGDEGSFYHIGGPWGNHTLYALLLSEELPQEIVDHLACQHISYAADLIAAWLATNSKVKFKLYQSEFTTSPAPSETHPL